MGLYDFTYTEALHNTLAVLSPSSYGKRHVIIVANVAASHPLTGRRIHITRTCSFITNY